MARPRVHRVSTPGAATGTTVARRIRIRGIVQGVGFRPFVFRLAQTHQLTGWVLNGSDGVEIHAEGSAAAVEAFSRDLVASPPLAATIASIESTLAASIGGGAFAIHESEAATHPTARISPDLPVCEACLAELFDRRNRRYGYPYINCTECGPRYSIIESLPYDRPTTTMAEWTMCDECRREYEDVSDRRFHAQPIACAACGPHVRLESDAGRVLVDGDAITAAAALLAGGAIVAIKGIGGYHVACDATNGEAVRALRERKYRKEQPFAIMVKNLAAARAAVRLSDSDEALLQSPPRPILVAPARASFAHVAPDNADLGVMLPYTPVHHLLFAAGAPAALVMTSGNRSSEPIAFEDSDARERLVGIADAMLTGERPIARRVDDSVQSTDAAGPLVVRRARGLAPGVVARLPVTVSILAVGADLKNAPLLVVGGDAVLATHIGDLEHHATRMAFERALNDLTRMYHIDPADLHVAHDAHPDYASTGIALGWPAARHTAVQHHRAHVASVMAERGELDTRVIGIAFDGTGYGDDGTIWGGEFFVGSVADGFTRVAHLRPASLIGGDAAARIPVQAAAGFVSDVSGGIDLSAAPFLFPPRYRQARQLLSTGIRVVTTTSAGRLFDTVAALLGFTRPVTFEGQAAIWLEHLARRFAPSAGYAIPFVDGQLDYRPALAAIIAARLRGDEVGAMAREFHDGLARGIADAAVTLADSHRVTTVALSGGVFQNALLRSLVRDAVTARRLRVLVNRMVPANDGGIALGQAALAGASTQIADRISRRTPSTVIP
jgi:hydrogenase maturation protein HypF